MKKPKNQSNKLPSICSSVFSRNMEANIDSLVILVPSLSLNLNSAYLRIIDLEPISIPIYNAVEHAFDVQPYNKSPSLEG
jgi:hypothetical protein